MTVTTTPSRTKTMTLNESCTSTWSIRRQWRWTSPVHQHEARSTRHSRVHEVPIHRQRSSRGLHSHGNRRIFNSQQWPRIPTKRLVHPFIEVAGWQQIMDEEMPNLRKLGYWTVIPLSSLPPNTPSWALDGHIPRKLMIMEHLHNTEVISLLKDFPKFSESTTLNPSRLLPPSLLFTRCWYFRY